MCGKCKSRRSRRGCGGGCCGYNRGWGNNCCYPIGGGFPIAPTNTFTFSGVGQSNALGGFPGGLGGFPGGLGGFPGGFGGYPRYL